MQDSQNRTTRRRFLQTTALAAAAFSLPTISSSAYASSIPYDGTLRDGLWMWGHETKTIQGHYKIPVGNPISQSEAIRSLGIPNVCVTRYQGEPVPPYDEFIKQFTDTKRVAWSVIDGAPQPYEQKKKDAIDISRKLPKLTTLFLDDFFIGSAVPKGTDGVSPAHLTLEQIKNLHQESASLARPLEVAIVLYSNQLHPGIAPYFEYSDVVSFWTWKATDLVNLEENFRRYRAIVPKKRTLLGIYMWDFGNSKPITRELMEHQCNLGLKWFKEGQIEGMIFHCTPLCGLPLDSVKWSREWIAKHGDEKTFK